MRQVIKYPRHDTPQRVDHVEDGQFRLGLADIRLILFDLIDNFLHRRDIFCEFCTQGGIILQPLKEGLIQDYILDSG